MDIERYLDDVKRQLKHCPVVVDRFYSLIDFIPTYADGPSLSAQDINFLSAEISKANLKVEPALGRGFIKRGIDAPIVFYKNIGEVDLNSKEFKFAKCIMRMAVIIARADNVIHDSELDVIRKVIWDAVGITKSERYFLFAKANYLLRIGLAYDEKTRDYIRIALDRNLVIGKIAKLSPYLQETVLEICKEVVVADSYLSKRELSVVQDLYRALGISARSAKFDLRKYASNKHIELREYQQKRMESLAYEDLDEIDNVLEDLVLDFEI